MILTIRTDKPESELGLYDNQSEIAYEKWQAHRQLAETIHKKIAELFDARGLTLSDITGIVIYQGPGSFTGLRIGMSVANALAYSLGVPIAATTGDEWIRSGVESLKINPNKTSVLPEYGAVANTTTPRK